MKLWKFTLSSFIGIPLITYGVCALATLDVKQISIPQGSLLNSVPPETWYKDCFEYTVDKKVGVDELNRAFWTSKVFKWEGRLVKHFLGGIPTTRSLLKTQVGDQHLLWKCVGKEENDLIWNWKLDSHEGHTWMSVKPETETKTTIYFGSSLSGNSPWIATHLHQLYSKLLLKSASQGL